jgi:hypothetical protein
MPLRRYAREAEHREAAQVGKPSEAGSSTPTRTLCPSDHLPGPNALRDGSGSCIVHPGGGGGVWEEQILVVDQVVFLVFPSAWLGERGLWPSQLGLQEKKHGSHRNTGEMLTAYGKSSDLCVTYARAGGTLHVSALESARQHVERRGHGAPREGLVTRSCREAAGAMRMLVFVVGSWAG